MVENPASEAWIVSLLAEIAWPLTVLSLGFMFKGGISSGIQSLFSKRGLKEFRAGGGGVTAIFEAERQETADSEEIARSAVFLPPGQTYEDLKVRHETQETPHSKRLYESVRAHIDALGISEEQKTDLLSKEVSLLQASLQWLDVSKVLFRSQFNLFSKLRDGEESVKTTGVESYFKAIASNNPTAFQGWDYTKYLAYPVSAGLLEYKGGSYQLTEFCKSFVDFMRMNPKLIDDLAEM